MTSVPRLKTYVFQLAARREAFSVGFTAMDDEAALAQISRWLEGRDTAAGEIVKIIRPDGREVPLTRALPARDAAPVPDGAIGGDDTITAATR